MTDNDQDVAKFARELESAELDSRWKASSVEQLIDLLDQCPVSAARANLPAARLVDGELVRWSEGDRGVKSDERVANQDIKQYARLKGIDLLVPIGIYYRWTCNPDEPALALSGTLRASKNHRTGVPERGLAVAEGPWLYCLNYPLCWFVEGHKVGAGSDGEPLLAVGPGRLTVHEDLMTRHDLLMRFYQRNRQVISATLNESPVSHVDLFGLLIGLHGLAVKQDGSHKNI